MAAAKRYFRHIIGGIGSVLLIVPSGHPARFQTSISRDEDMLWQDWKNVGEYLRSSTSEMNQDLTARGLLNCGKS